MLADDTHGIEILFGFLIAAGPVGALEERIIDVVEQILEQIAQVTAQGLADGDCQRVGAIANPVTPTGVGASKGDDVILLHNHDGFRSFTAFRDV